jgi:hypothetical protein
MQHENAIGLGLKAKLHIPSPVNFSGDWKNQYGSRMTLVLNGNTISGDYWSAVSGGGSPVSGPIRGFVAGDLISFAVLWPNGSMTTWVGQMVDDASDPRLKTLWHLVMNVEDDNEATEIWASIFAGADEFIR